jgi:hypothetical protein
MTGPKSGSAYEQQADRICERVFAVGLKQLGRYPRGSGQRQLMEIISRYEWWQLRQAQAECLQLHRQSQEPPTGPYKQHADVIKMMSDFLDRIFAVVSDPQGFGYITLSMMIGGGLVRTLAAARVDPINDDIFMELAAEYRRIVPYSETEPPPPDTR